MHFDNYMHIHEYVKEYIYIYIYIYVCVCVCVCVCARARACVCVEFACLYIYIYIYREREGGREKTEKRRLEVIENTDIEKYEALISAGYKAFLFQL